MICASVQGRDLTSFRGAQTSLLQRVKTIVAVGGTDTRSSKQPTYEQGHTDQGIMLVLLLPVLFLVLAVHPSASSPDAAPSTSSVFRVPETTVIGGRLFYKHALLPVDDCYKENADSELKRAMLKETLAPLLAQPLIGIIVDYSIYGSFSRQFAEKLYHELYAGRTDLLCKDLYDLKKKTLKGSHHFWDYLSGGGQPVAAFVHMLWETQWKHPRLKKTLRSFARLVRRKAPQTAYCVACYLDRTMPFPLGNISLDEWPQALLDDQAYFESIGKIVHDMAAVVYYFLTQGNGRRLKNYLDAVPLEGDKWFYVLNALHAAEPALLHKFFDIGFIQAPSCGEKMFGIVAPAAISIDPSLSKVLIDIAKSNGWAKPAAEKIRTAELADNGEAGGSVHMQPLMPVAQSTDNTFSGRWCAASATRKTVANIYGLQLHIGSGNALYALSNLFRYYIHIRSLENGKVRTYKCAADDLIMVEVQHGNLISISRKKKCPLFLQKQPYYTRLSGEDRFERAKSFAHLAKDSLVDFVAIVQSDERNQEERFIGAMKELRVSSKREEGKSEERASKGAKEKADGWKPRRKQEDGRMASAECDRD